MRRQALVLSGWLGAGIFAFAQSTEATPRVWQVGVETDSAPYSFQNAAGQPDGFSVDLLKEVAATQGLSLIYEAKDWPAILADFRAGRIDVLCNVVDTVPRHEFIAFSTTTFTVTGRVYVRKNGPVIKSVEDLRGLRIALSQVSRADDYLNHHDLGLTRVYVANLAEALRELANNRADVVFSTRLATEAVLREQNYPNIVLSDLAPPDFGYNLHFGVAKDNPALLAQLNEGLAELYQNGTYDRLYERWLGRLEPRPLKAKDLQPYLLPFAAIVLVIIGIFLWQRSLLRHVSAQGKAIRENEERLRLVFEGSQDGFWDWEIKAGRILRSPRWAGMLGYTLEEIGPARNAFLKLVHPDDLPLIEDDFKLLLAGRDHSNLEFRMKAKTGEWRWILDRGKVITRDPKTGAPLRIAGTHTDITARKQAEEQSTRLERKMQETQKLESLGVLAGGIAHDFNNLLTVILGNSTLARMDAAESSTVRARLDSVVTSAQRAAELCHQLLAYAGRASYSLEHLEINEIVTETTRLLEMSIGRQAKLSYQLAEGLPTIEADSAQLRQVIMNLVINAAEALDHKAGNIQITTSTAQLPLQEMRSPGTNEYTSTGESTGEHVCVSVTDTGAGMTAEVLTRIFDPFFSTKFAGRGLGLAAVLGIVRAHRGMLKVQSSPGRGTTFRLFLPVASGPAATFSGKKTVQPLIV